MADSIRFGGDAAPTDLVPHINFVPQDQGLTRFI